MQDINSVTIVGRITRDLDDKTYRVSAGGVACANISLAVNKSVKKDNQWTDEASFIDVVIFGKTAENLKQYLTKGTQVGILGYLKQDRWQDKEGHNRSSISVVANTVQLLGGKRDSGNNTQPQQSNFKPDEGYPEDMPF